MDEVVKIIKELQDRIDTLERLLALEDIVIPTSGKLVVDIRASDPPAQNARIYYNSTIHKLKVTENGVWKTVTTT